MKRGKPLKIGITGGIGAGKSLVLKFLKDKGIPVLQTDKIGHDLLRKKEWIENLSRHFGRTILGSDGQIDRVKMALEIFENPQKRRLLNDLFHPAIRREVSKWVSAQEERKRPPKFLVVEVPLLFERGYYRWFDHVLCVSAPPKVRRNRLLKRGWSNMEIRQRGKSQWPQERKNKKSDWVIFNGGTRKELKYAVDRWLNEFLTRASLSRKSVVDRLKSA